MCYTKSSLPENAMLKSLTLFALIILFSLNVSSQTGSIRWSKDGNSYYRIENNQITKYTLPDNKTEVVISKKMVTPAGSDSPLRISF